MSEIDSVEASFRSIEREVERSVGEARAVAVQGKEAKEEVAGLEQRLEVLEQAIGVMSKFADARQEELQRRLEVIVTHGLQVVFGEELTFHVTPVTRGKLAAYDFTVRSKIGEQEVETPIMDARGGGVAAVAGFLLRLVILLLRKDARHVLFLDESFAQLSADYEPRLADFLRELVDRTGAQLVLVTHSTAYDDVADVSYRFSNAGGVTKIEKL